MSTATATTIATRKPHNYAVKGNGKLVKRRDETVRRLFSAHASDLRSTMTEVTIQHLDEMAASGDLTQQHVAIASAAYSIGVENVAEYLSGKYWALQFDELFNDQYTLSDWIDLYEIRFLYSNECTHEQAIGHLEGLAIWWETVLHAAEPSDSNQPKRRKSAAA